MCCISVTKRIFYIYVADQCALVGLLYKFKIHRTRLRQGMKMVSFPNKLVRLVRLKTEQEISICIYNQTSTLFSSDTGLKQEAVAPLLLI